MKVYGAPCKTEHCAGVILFLTYPHLGEPDPIVFALPEPEMRECPTCHESHLYSEIGPYDLPSWVNLCEREPEMNKELQVLVVERGTGVEYARAKAPNSGWMFMTESVPGQIVAWLESDYLLDDRALRDVSKEGLRF